MIAKLSENKQYYHRHMSDKLNEDFETISDKLRITITKKDVQAKLDGHLVDGVRKRVVRRIHPTDSQSYHVVILDLSEYNIDMMIGVHCGNDYGVPVVIQSWEYHLTKKELKIRFGNLHPAWTNTDLITIDYTSKIDQRNKRIEDLGL